MLLCLIDSVSRNPLNLLLFYTVAEMFYFNYRSVQYKWCVFCTLSRFVIGVGKSESHGNGTKSKRLKHLNYSVKCHCKSLSCFRVHDRYLLLHHPIGYRFLQQQHL